MTIVDTPTEGGFSKQKSILKSKGSVIYDDEEDDGMFGSPDSYGNRRSTHRSPKGKSPRDSSLPNHFKLSHDGSDTGLVKQHSHADSSEGLAMSLKRVNDIKTKVNVGLAKATGTKNKNVIKKTIKDMKNPIITSIKKTLNLSNNKLTKDYYLSM